MNPKNNLKEKIKKNKKKKLGYRGYLLEENRKREDYLKYLYRCENCDFCFGGEICPNCGSPLSDY